MTGIAEFTPVIMQPMNKIWVPETFRNKPYPGKHFSEIAAWATQNHPFYQLFYKNPDLEIPIITRDMITDNNDLLLNGHKETGRTSGSTGVPVRIAWPAEKEQKENESLQIFRHWVGPKLHVLMVVSQLEAAGKANSFDICKPLHEQADFIQQYCGKNTELALVTYPSNAVLLAQYFIDNKLDLSDIKRLVCYAESFDDGHTDVFKEAFPEAKIWNNYSSSEVGVMALRCPHEPDYMHVMGRNIGMEVLNDDNLPCQEGETGRIVVTDFFNKFSPFIRYDIGDLAIPGVCPCNQIGFPALQKVLGKVRGFLKDEQGNPRIFANIGAELKQIDGLRQYQIIQEEETSLKVRFVINEADQENHIKNQLQKCIWDFIGFEPVLHFNRETVIERASNGKFYACICKI